MSAEIQQIQQLQEQLQQIQQQHQDEIICLRFDYEKKLLECEDLHRTISRNSGPQTYYDLYNKMDEEQYEQKLHDKLAKIERTGTDITLQHLSEVLGKKPNF